MASIIIPAHNEAGVIRRTLETLLEGLDVSATEIIVVCNGCTDNTAEEADLVDGPIRVIVIEPASKTKALNAGDAEATSYPRLYIDADIDIDGGSVNRIVHELERPGALAAEPVPRIDVSHSSRPVGAYYAVALALHGQRPGDVGSGVYAMSIDGRGRFGSFPAVIADDAYARAHFGSDELVHVEAAESVVRAPATMADLLQIKTRSRVGTVELQQKYPEIWAHKSAHTESLGSKAAGLPARMWPVVPLYVAVQLVTRFRARAAVRNLDSFEWQRDDSSRRPPS